MVPDEPGSGIVSTPSGMPISSVPPKPVETTLIPFERAHMLAKSNWKRLNEFVIGAFCVALPGSAQTAWDFFVAGHIPEVGHAVEVVLAIGFGFLTMRSLFAEEPTSKELLRQLFPEATKRKGKWNEFKYWWLGDP